MRQERNPTTVSQLMVQIRKLQNKDSSLSDAREFYDPESGSSSGATHVPDQNPYCSECWDLATLRFWIAAKHTDVYKYYGRRF